MRIITLHCDYIRFKPLKKALKNVEELKEKGEIEVKEPLVVLTAIEKEDSSKTIAQLIDAVKKTAGEVKAKNIVLYPYAHLSSNLANPDKALGFLVEAESTLKTEGFNVTRAPFGYYKEFELKVKGHPLSELSKEFHPENLSVTPRELVNKTQEKRITGHSSKEKKIILDRRNLKPNDHRILGEDLNIFYLSDEIGPGLPLWLPHGETIRNQLIQYMREVEEKAGFKYVSTPHIAKGHLYEKTGHLPYYADTMYPPIEIEGVNYYLKPMNCPHHHMIFNKLVKSYRDLPLRLAEAGTVYRNELSGVTYGLMRVRALTQNDAHIYLMPEQLKDEFKKVLEMFDEVLGVVGIKDYWYRLSLPDFKNNPEKYTGDPKIWVHASEEIKKAMKESKKKFLEGEGEASFYGPKIDVQIKNSQGKEETLATSQIDIVIPNRLNLNYVDEKGNKNHPIIIHRAIIGSYERFIAFLLEQNEGKFPLWLSPVQVRVINFTDRNTKAAQNIIDNLKKEIPNLRVDSDFKNTIVSEKVRDSELMKIPYSIVIGDKEEASKTLAVRARGAKPKFGVTIGDLIEELKEKLEKRN